MYKQLCGRLTYWSLVASCSIQQALWTVHFAVDYARFGAAASGIERLGGGTARVTSAESKAGLIRTPAQLFNANGGVITLAAKPT